MKLNRYDQYVTYMNELVSRVRSYQHEFANHLSALEGMHYMTNDYDTLVKMQDEYILKNRMPHAEYRLLYLNNPVLAGFFYHCIKEELSMGLKIHIRVLSDNLPDKRRWTPIFAALKNVFESCFYQLETNHYHEVLYLEIDAVSGCISVKLEYRERKLSVEQRGELLLQNSPAAVSLRRAKRCIKKCHGKLVINNQKKGIDNYLSIQVLI